MKLRFAILLLLMLNAATAAAVEPQAALLDAFSTHRLVALGHHADQSQALVRALIANPRFATTVNDIVVEFGSARYQSVMDRFQNGEDVPIAELQQSWQNTTNAGTHWDGPVIEQFFRAVRAVNDALPAKHKLRVLLGEPPLDWSLIQSEAVFSTQLLALGNRDGHVAALIEREVLARGRRALILYGTLHFQRRNILANYGSSWPDADTLVMQLEKQKANRVFTVWTVQQPGKMPGDPASWPVPTLIRLKGSPLGALDFGDYFSYSGERREIRNGAAVVIPRSEWRTLPMEDQFDALLYLGPTLSLDQFQLSRSKCSDADYLQMRLSRMALLSYEQASVEKLKAFCKE